MIGILALQGAFEKHAYSCHQLGVKTFYVKKTADLQGCRGLIIPGGESTVMRLHLERMAMLPPLKQFAKEYPIFGTCAGLILMTQDLELLDLKIQRNGFGTQIHSFSYPLESDTFCNLRGVFIRAPRIIEYGNSVSVLASYRSEPVLVRQGDCLAATFHPELTDDLQIHRTFLSMVKGEKFSTDRLFVNIEIDRASDEDLPARTQIG